MSGEAADACHTALESADTVMAAVRSYQAREGAREGEDFRSAWYPAVRRALAIPDTLCPLPPDRSIAQTMRTSPLRCGSAIRTPELMLISQR
ncbi:hypothetical protein GCM10017688_64150 [Streptomyces ramulosus]